MLCLLVWNKSKMPYHTKGVKFSFKFIQRTCTCKLIENHDAMSAAAEHISSEMYGARLILLHQHESQFLYKYKIFDPMLVCQSLRKYSTVNYQTC